MAPSQKGTAQFIRSPRLNQIEFRFSHYPQPAFAKHIHDTYSISLVQEGQTDFFCDNQTRLICPGEIALINPGQVHACNPKNGSALTYYLLYIEPNLISDISCTLFGKKASTAEFAIPIVANKLLYCRLIKLCQAMLKAPNELEVETMLYETLAQMIWKYGNNSTGNPVQKPGSARLIEKGRAYLMEHLYHNVTISELATGCGLSPFHFLREFRKRFGLPPHTYQLQQRVNVAKRLLAKGQPIVQVASEVGFADQSHFTRKFKSYVGATPRQYQLANH